ncbi:LacI family DNA-binding transcriptional regulator [Tessaracoccus sp.]|uniref:LacI family DNA-binding transcriptional regulator n=1 Tax=Tessaracoccus sp. TaxID=1971211 RepID=UPI002632E61B|nr:LacI family DNA-binding transcriptional regulator [Tessaracoccus sp.]
MAARAGVSQTTVSHVLNKTPHTRVSADTAARVRAAAEELGYRPNRLARGLRTQASDLIGLVTEEIAATPHAGRIILGAQEEASRLNLTLAIINSELNPNPQVNAAQVQAFLDRQADGIIYATVYHDEVVVPENLRSRPAVLIGARDSAGTIPAVLPDERAGAASVVEMLIKAGHRRIGFAASTQDVPATRGRLLGYLDAVRAAGLSVDDLVVTAEADARGGYRATLDLLEQRPTAVFCYNDRMAMGAYRAAGERGLAVPTDLSVVGFDDQAPIPDSLFPTLTTVALPQYEMGAWAVATLGALIRGREEEASWTASPTVLSCPIVERESVAPPRMP